MNYKQFQMMRKMENTQIPPDSPVNELNTGNAAAKQPSPAEKQLLGAAAGADAYSLAPYLKQWRKQKAGTPGTVNQQPPSTMGNDFISAVKDVYGNGRQGYEKAVQNAEQQFGRGARGMWNAAKYAWNRFRGN